LSLKATRPFGGFFNAYQPARARTRVWLFLRPRFAMSATRQLQGVPAVIAASNLIRNLPKLTGMSEATVRGVYRKLNEAGFLPSSHGATIAKLGPTHVIMLLLALMADVPAKDAVSAGRAYYALADEHGNAVGEVLTNMLNSFRSVNPAAALAYKSRVELDCDSPRVRIVSECDDGSNIETLYGVHEKPWLDVRVRRSMTVSGKVLFDLAMGVHFNRWEITENA
jgi:hypothetical protein